jgi:hypothetical protein
VADRKVEIRIARQKGGEEDPNGTGRGPAHVGGRRQAHWGRRLIETRVVQFGLGSMGRSVARLLTERPGLELVGGIDIDPLLQGRSLGEVIGVTNEIGALIWDDPLRALSTLQPDVVTLCTGSYLDRVRDHLIQCITSGANVVSTCEELSFPAPANEALWEELDDAARSARVTVLGTGVNPGFAMDALPLFMTSVLERIERIRIHRVQNAATRRPQLQKKVGVGFTQDEFRLEAARGRVGHVGLLESALMIGDHLGWNFEEVETSLEPAIAASRLARDGFIVERGNVAGIHQELTATVRGSVVLRLILDIAVNVEESRDHIVIEGKPPVNLIVQGGLHGDFATSAITVNVVPRVVAAAPGLLTLPDLPMPVPIGAV